MKGAKRSWVRSWVYLLAISIMASLSACAGKRPSTFAPGKDLGLVLSGVPSRKASAEGPGLPRNVHPGPDAATLQEFRAVFHQLPLSFIPNRGQVDERVAFYGRSGSASFFFARDEVVYSFVHREEKASSRRVNRSGPREDPSPRGEEKARGHVVRLQFVGANPDPLIEGREELPGKMSYFIGQDPARWKKALPTYGQVRYRELWPGIDLIYGGQGGQLKYEFVVKPGADPSQIRLAYQGIEGISMSDAGDLILKTTSGELRDIRPYAYQEVGGRRVEVEAGFRIERRDNHRADTAHPGLVHGFEVRGYDPAYPLILDPGLDYATFLGGSSEDEGSGIALDGAGNAVVTGGTLSPDFPTTAGAFDTSFNGNSDAFITKIPIIDGPVIDEPAPTADLTLAMTVSPSCPVTVRDLLTYTVTVTNNGPAVASRVILTSSLSFVMLSPRVTPSHGSFVGCGIGQTAEWSVVTCDLVMMGVGASATIIIDGRLATAGTITNTATVTVTGRQTDPEMANNTATATTVVEPGPLAIGAPALLEGEIQRGVPRAFFQVSFSFEISGGTSPYTVRLVKGSLPPEVLLFDDGNIRAGISGSTHRAGSSRFTIRVTDQAGSSVSKSFTINVFRVLNITTRSLPKGKAGKRYRAILKAKGGKKPYTWSWGGVDCPPEGASFCLPEGLSLDSSTGEITGTPTTSGTFTPTFQVTSSLGGFDQRPFSITIRPLRSRRGVR